MMLSKFVFIASSHNQVTEYPPMI